MIKRGDKGTIDKLQARVIADDIVGEFPLAIEVIYENGSPGIYLRNVDGTTDSKFNSAFIPSKPWDSIKPGDACLVKSTGILKWIPRVYAGINECGKPTTYEDQKNVIAWDYCVPTTSICGELILVKEEE